jgi:hypothetical protein
MAFQANVLKVMIASPGDVAKERTIVTEELHRWNDANAVSRQLMLQPVKWETHSSPQMGAHPQVILNERLLLDAEIVVGIFGTRIGTATEDYISGSVEEIKRHVAAGKLAMLYFSNVPVAPSSIDEKQLVAVQQFKEECQTTGLYAEYESHEQFRTNFGQHLAIELNRPKYLWLAKPDVNVEPGEPELDDNERSLLMAGASDRNGHIMTGSTMGGIFVQANERSFVEDSPRSEALWKRVLRRLLELDYLERVGDGLYQLTAEGYARADKEMALVPLEISLSFAGAPDNQQLSIAANKVLIPNKLDFLMSSGAYVAGMELSEQPGSTAMIPLDYPKIRELFNSPRTDRNHATFEGPASLRLTFTSDGRRSQVVLPILLQSKLVNNTQWVQLVGEQTFTVK